MPSRRGGLNFSFHLAVLVILQYGFMQYWYVFANRYVVLNFQESAFLPARYAISGVVAGAFIYWLYLLPLGLIRRLWRGYQHPRWWLLWAAVVAIGGTQTLNTLRDASQPPVTLWAALMAVFNLQLYLGLTLWVASRPERGKAASLWPSPPMALMFIGLWGFWLAYSFWHEPQGEPRPLIGTPLERYALGLVLGGLALACLLSSLQPVQTWLAERRFSGLEARQALAWFFSSLAGFYLFVPVFHYLLRGYVIAHSTLFPAFFLGALVPIGWSLVYVALRIGAREGRHWLAWPRPARPPAP
jgi:hypothetical protein